MELAATRSTSASRSAQARAARNSSRSRHIDERVSSIPFRAPWEGLFERGAKRSTPSPDRARRREDVVLGRARSRRLRTRHCVLASHPPNRTQSTGLHSTPRSRWRGGFSEVPGLQEVPTLSSQQISI